MSVHHFSILKYFSFQSDLIHRIQKDKALNEIPAYKSLMENFTNLELVIMNLQQYSKRGFCLRSNEKNVIKWFISWIYSVLFIHKKTCKINSNKLKFSKCFPDWSTSGRGVRDRVAQIGRSHSGLCRELWGGQKAVGRPEKQGRRAQHQNHGKVLQQNHASKVTFI